jgi:hypothetical protein
VIPGPFGFIAPNGPGAPLGRPLSRALGVVQAVGMRMCQVACSRDSLLLSRLALHIALFFPGSLPKIGGRGLGRAAPWTLPLLIDTILDRSVVLGYGNTGFEVRRRLPGWPADPPRMDGKTVLVTGAALLAPASAPAGRSTCGRWSAM